ncbi:MAG: MFS transporter [Acidimicrobiales bacterium]
MVSRYGWAPLVALAVTVALEQGERQSLSQAVDGIQHRFHVSDTAIGFLPFAMALVGVVGAFPFGMLADRRRRTGLLAAGVFIWTICMGANALATSYAFLFAARLGVGALEGNSPAAVSLLADYYPVEERAKNMGLYQSGALVGAIVGLIGGGVAVGLGGWRWAFVMWVPLGLAATAFVHRQPEPRRGEQDLAFADREVATALDLADGAGLVEAVEAISARPVRVGTMDYERAPGRAVLRELMRIKSMWFGVMSLTISQLLLNGLQFWGVPYFKRVHHLGAAGAGAVTALLGVGSVFGILGGGVLADRLLRRGMVNARVYVVAFGSMLATAVMLPAFLSTTLVVTAPLLFVGGALLTLPVAPAEAIVSDVVVAELRGRAATVRSVVRALSTIGPLLIGGLSTFLVDQGQLSRADGLRLAIVALTPLYAIGGLIMLFAARTYPGDIAFVMAEARRNRPASGEDLGAPTSNVLP